MVPLPKKTVLERLDLIQDLSGRAGNMTYAESCNRNAYDFADRIALVDRRHRLGLGDVKTISDRIALALFERNVMRPYGGLIHLPNIAEQYLLRLACEKAGVRVVLTSTWFREAELVPIFEATRPK